MFVLHGKVKELRWTAHVCLRVEAVLSMCGLQHLWFVYSGHNSHFFLGVGLFLVARAIAFEQGASIIFACFPSSAFNAECKSLHFWRFCVIFTRNSYPTKLL